MDELEIEIRDIIFGHGYDFNLTPQQIERMADSCVCDILALLEDEKYQADDKLKKLLPKTPEPEIVIEDFRLFCKR